MLPTGADARNVPTPINDLRNNDLLQNNCIFLLGKLRQPVEIKIADSDNETRNKYLFIYFMVK